MKGVGFSINKMEEMKRMNQNIQGNGIELSNAQSTPGATPPQETTIIVIIDESGSMKNQRDIAIETVNEFINGQRNQEGSAKLSLYLFQDYTTSLCEGAPISDAPTLSRETYVPRGQTALFDAIGMAIQENSARTENTCVIVAIMTDGKENRSSRFTLDEIKTLIQEKEALGWDFIYLSADLDAFSSAQAMGIRREHVHVFDKTADGFASTRNKMSDAVDEKRRHGSITGVQQTNSGQQADVISVEGRQRVPRPRSQNPRRRDDPREPRGIQNRRMQFWQRLILRHPHEGSRLHAHCFPPSGKRLVAEGDVPGTALVYSIYPRSAIVAFRVARDDGVMSQLYERLLENRERITEVFGGDLEFYEGKEKKYDYIRIVMRNGGLNNRRMWRTIQSEMIEAMERLNSAIMAVM